MTNNKLITAQHDEEYLNIDCITEAEISDYVNQIIDLCAKLTLKAPALIAGRNRLISEKLTIKYVADGRALGAAYCSLNNLDTWGILELRPEYTQMACTHMVADEIANTIIHEIAHFVAGAEHAHDGTWSNVATRIAKAAEKAGIYTGNKFFSSSSSSVIVADKWMAYVDSYGDVCINYYYTPAMAEKWGYTVIEYIKNGDSASHNMCVERAIDYKNFMGM